MTAEMTNRVEELKREFVKEKWEVVQLMNQNIEKKKDVIHQSISKFSSKG